MVRSLRYLYLAAMFLAIGALPPSVPSLPTAEHTVRVEARYTVKTRPRIPLTRLFLDKERHRLAAE